MATVFIPTQSEPFHTGYALVRLSKNVIRTIKIANETDRLVTGWRVDPTTGERWFRETKTEVREEIVVAQTSDIIRRLVLNTRYGELELNPMIEEK